MTASATLSNDALDRAKALLQTKQWQACLQAVDEALAEAAGAHRVAALIIKARVLFLHLRREREGLEAIEEAVALDPSNGQVLEVLARLRHLSGAAAAAFAIYKRIYRSGEQPGRALAGLFEILMERKRYAAATRLAASVEARNGRSPSLRRDLVEIALVRHDAKTAFEITGRSPAADTPPKVELFQRIARSLEAELAAGDTMAGYRHIGIGGVAFTGSTALGVILGSMPGFSFAGETQWLTSRRDASGAMEPIGTPERWPVACRVCKHGCQCFDVPFRVSLAANGTGWYAKIADRLGTRNLISADKNLHLYWELDPLFRFDYIVLYKPPLDFLRSLFKQHLRRPEPRPVVDRQWVFGALDRWAYNYFGHLKTIRPTGLRAVLDWGKFAAEPGRHMRQLSERLHIPLRPDTLEHIRLGHFIGGNTGVDVAALKADPRFVLRPSNAPTLPDEVVAMALEHGRAQGVARLLDAEYRRQFPA